MYVSRPGAEPNGVPILRISAVRPMRLDTADLRYTGMSLSDVRARGGLVKPGDLLFTRYNGNPEFVGACARVPEGTEELAYPDKLIRVVIPERYANSRFISYACAWEETRAQIRSVIKNTAGQAGISGSSLKRLRLPLPPLLEQQRIVEALDTHLESIERASKSLTTAAARSKALMHRLMSMQFKASEHTMVELRDIADVRLGRQRSPKNHSGSQMRPYLRAANVGWDGLKLDDVKKMNFTDRELDSYRLRPKDIVLSEASGSPGEVGKPAIWNGEIEDCCFQNTLIRVRPTAVHPEYLFNFLRCAALRGDFRSGARGVGIHHLGAAKLSRWPIPLPSKEDQLRIAEVIEEQLTSLAVASSAVQAAGAVPLKASALRKSLLRKAFAGQLVSQDPTDEPASAVLDRIRAERAAQAKPKRTRRAAQRKVPAAPAPEPTPAPRTSVQ